MKSFWVYDKNTKEVYAIPLCNILDTLNVLVGLKSNIIYFDNKQSAEKMKESSPTQQMIDDNTIGIGELND
jgi:hypothetical protein|tara:strand:- start:386 stop:598 length:213 start_codon:yes stop_codon:yes gene_type:complete